MTKSNQYNTDNGSIKKDVLLRGKENNIKANKDDRSNEDTIEAVDKGIGVLEEDEIIKRDCGDFLRETTDVEVRRASKLKDDVENEVDRCVSGEISISKCLEKINIMDAIRAHSFKKVPKAIAEFLTRKEVLVRKSDGYITIYPFFPYLYRILDHENDQHIKGNPLKLVNSAVRLVAKQLGTHTILRERESLAYALTMKVGREPAVMFSRTPAIFNPFEFKFDNIKLSIMQNENEKLTMKKKKNYTERLCETLKMVEHSVVYVWNKNAIITQIEEQLKEEKMSIDKLHKLYFDHFKQYSNQSNIEIFWGDNSAMIDPKGSLQYISESNLIIGRREGKEDRMSFGILLNMQRVKNILRMIVGTTVALGTSTGDPSIRIASGALAALLSAGVIDTLLCSGQFISMKEKLVSDVDYTKLSDKPSSEIVDIVFDEFLKEKR